MMIRVLFFFFFSSRRRHTRCLSDWSSDVCSSDLQTQSGEGALRFARQIGFPECSPEALIVEAERKRWREKHGTVGCVTLDAGGKIAVATSTGGIFGKIPGRIGDSPLLGCGTYADEDGGVSCTGHGAAI